MPEQVWAVMPAAGVGRRMSADLPKQYMTLAGVTIIQRTLSAIAACGLCEGLVLVLSVDDDRFASDVLPQLDATVRERLQVVEGGSDRAASVLAGVESLGGRAGDSDWVLVHDVARPLVSAGDIDNLYRQVTRRASDDIAGGILAERLHDTIKRATTHGEGSAEIARSEDRALLWAAQTPQLFRIGQLRAALQSARDAGVVVTDEAMAIERAGGRVLLVAGSAANLKITTRRDLALAKLLLGASGEAVE